MREGVSSTEGTASSTEGMASLSGEGASSLFTNTGKMSAIEGLVVSFSNPNLEGTFSWLTMGDVDRLDTSLSI